jgi:putative endonuclease
VSLGDDVSGSAKTWSVYLLRCGDGSLYTGIARNVAQRFDAHARGRGARYTRGRGPLTLVYVEPAACHGDALRREASLRRLSRAEKEVVIARFAAVIAARGTGRGTTP